MARFDHPGSAIRDRALITQKQLGEATPLHQATALNSTLLGSRRWLVINALHPTVERLLAIAATEPETAAFLLGQLLLMRADLDPQAHTALAMTAWQQRWKRLSA